VFDLIYANNALIDRRQLNLFHFVKVHPLKLFIILKKQKQKKYIFFNVLLK
jgi:hypothetical protein